MLVAAGADVDLQLQLENGDLWDTPLHIAAWYERLSAGDQIENRDTTDFDGCCGGGVMMVL